MPLAFEASDNSDFDLVKKEVRVDFADDTKLLKTHGSFAWTIILFNKLSLYFFFLFPLTAGFFLVSNKEYKKGKNNITMLSNEC